MSLENTTKTNIAFKNLLGKSHTDNSKELGNEKESYFFNLPSSAIFAETIDPDPVVAEAANVVLKLTVNLSIDETSNNHAYFATHSINIPEYGIVAGTRVNNVVSPTFGYKYEVKIYEENSGLRIPIDDSRNWVFQYESGIYYQELTSSPIPGTAELYMYIGETFLNIGETKANVNGDNIEKIEFNNSLTSFISTSFDIYISAIGNDLSGTGEVSTPYQTLQRAFKDLSYTTILNDIIVTIILDDSSFEINQQIIDYLSTITFIGNSRVRIQGNNLTESLSLDGSVPDALIPFKYNITSTSFNTTTDFYKGYFIQNSIDYLFYPIASSGDKFVYTTSDINPVSIYELTTTITSSLRNPFGTLEQKINTGILEFININFDFDLDTISYFGNNQTLSFNTCFFNKTITFNNKINLIVDKSLLLEVTFFEKGKLAIKNTVLTDLNAVLTDFKDNIIESTIFYKTTGNLNYVINSNCTLLGNNLVKSNLTITNIFITDNQIAGTVLYTDLNINTDFIDLTNSKNIKVSFANIVGFKSTADELTKLTNVSLNNFILIGTENKEYFNTHIYGFDLKTDIETLDYPLVFCRENNKIYKYVITASDFVVDNNYVLNTADHGDTRYISLEYNNLIINNSNLVLDDNFKIITTENILPTALAEGSTGNNDKLATSDYIDEAVENILGNIIRMEGDWDADTNTPPIDGTLIPGYAWKVSVAGSTELDGITNWRVGDLVIKSNNGWLKMPSNLTINDISLSGSNGLIGEWSGITINVDNTKINIAEFEYIFIDLTDFNNPRLVRSTCEGFVGVIPEYLTIVGITSTYFAYDPINNILIHKNAPFEENERWDYIPLGNAVHSNNINVNATNNLPDVAIKLESQLHDTLDYLGAFNINGNLFSPNGSNKKVNKTLGNLCKRGSGYNSAGVLRYKRPNAVTLGELIGSPDADIRHRLRNLQEYIYETGDTIDTEHWDNNGVKELIPVGKFTIHRLAIPVSNKLRVQIGQFLYDSISEALQAISTEQFIPEQNLNQNFLFRCALVVESGCTELNNETKARFMELDRFGNPNLGSSIGATTTMQQSYEVSAIPKIKLLQTKGAISYQTGDDMADIDNILEVWNKLGVGKFAVRGDGTVKGSDAVNDDEFVTKGQLTNATLGLFDDRGSYNPTITSKYPITGGSGTAGVIMKGDIWTISADGNINGIPVLIGYTVRALIDSPDDEVDANWSISNVGIGYIPLKPSNNLSDVSSQQTALNNVTGVSSAEIGQVLYKNNGGDVDWKDSTIVNLSHSLFVDSVFGDDISGDGTILFKYKTLDKISTLTNKWSGTQIATKTSGSRVITNISDVDYNLMEVGDSFAYGSGLVYNTRIITKDGGLENAKSVTTSQTQSTGGFMPVWIRHYTVYCKGNFVPTTNLAKEGMRWVFKGSQISWGDLTLFNISDTWHSDYILEGGLFIGTHANSRFINCVGQNANFKYYQDCEIYSSTSTTWLIQIGTQSSTQYGFYDIKGIIRNMLGRAIAFSDAKYLNLEAKIYGLLQGVSLYSVGNAICNVDIETPSPAYAYSINNAYNILNGRVQGDIYISGTGGKTICNARTTGSINLIYGYFYLNGWSSCDSPSALNIDSNSECTVNGTFAGRFVNMAGRLNFNSTTVISVLQGSNITGGVLEINCPISVVSQITQTGGIINYRSDAGPGHYSVPLVNISSGELNFLGKITRESATVPSIIQSGGIVRIGNMPFVNTSGWLITKSGGTLIFLNSYLKTNGKSPILCTANTSASKDIYVLGCTTNCDKITHGLKLAFGKIITITVTADNLLTSFNFFDGTNTTAISYDGLGLGKTKNEIATEITALINAITPMLTRTAMVVNNVITVSGIGEGDILASSLVNATTVVTVPLNYNPNPIIENQLNEDVTYNLG